MSLRFSLAAAAALIGLGVLTAPALAIQTIQIPDPQSPANAQQTPDGLFDNSIPDSWQKKGDPSDTQLNTGGFHFSMHSSNSQYNPTSTSSVYHDPMVPGSVFYQPLPGTTDPYLPH